MHVPYAHEQVLTRTDPQPSLAMETITEALRISVVTAVGAVSAGQQEALVPAGPAPVP